LRLWAGRGCSDIEDVVQQAFCRLATLDPVPTRPAAWLFRAVRNAAFSQVRADNRRRRREFATAVRESQQADPADRLIAVELVAAVNELDDPQRQVLIARIWGELTLEETAELCGVSTATAFRQYRAALQALRRKMGVSCLNSND